MHLSRDITRLRAAIKLAAGNLTRAAKTLGVSKPYCMELVRRAGLNDWARGIRQENHQPATGHPRSR